MWGEIPLRMMVSRSRTPRPILMVLYSRRKNTAVSITRQPVQEMAESKNGIQSGDAGPRMMMLNSQNPLGVCVSGVTL